ncbi:hypothetical protein GGH99_006146, partial [Coemansia sp. RSA 1285]
RCYHQSRRRRVHRRNQSRPPSRGCLHSGRRHYQCKARRCGHHSGRRSAPLPLRPRRPRRHLCVWLHFCRHRSAGREHPAAAPRSQAVATPDGCRADCWDSGALAEELL